MQITLNEKIYDTDTMSTEAVNLVNRIINCTAAEEVQAIAKLAYTEKLTEILEANEDFPTDAE
jgi:hypothetical protein